MTKYLVVIALLMMGCNAHPEDGSILMGLELNGELKWLEPDNVKNVFRFNDMNGDVEIFRIDYETVTVDTNKVLNICFDDQDFCLTTKELKEHTATAIMVKKSMKELGY